MKTKQALTVVSLALAFVALAAIGWADDEQAIKQEYTLVKGQGEILATLLRYDLPQNTAIETRRQGVSCTVIVTAPQEIHDAIGPFVKLLSESYGAHHREEFERRKAEGAKLDELERQRRRQLPPNGHAPRALMLARTAE